LIKVRSVERNLFVTYNLYTFINLGRMQLGLTAE